MMRLPPSCTHHKVKLAIGDAALKYDIRNATEKDMPFLIEELKGFSKFFNSSIPLMPSDEAAEKILSVFIKDHFFRIGEIDGKPVGFISGLIGPHLYNPGIKVLTESFWWVKPEYRRRTKIGSMLFDDFCNYGERYCDWIIMTIEDNSPVNENIFLKRGFRFKEKSFIYEAGK